MAHILYDTLYDLKVPCPRSNSGKRTLAYTATKLFNDLSSDLKEFSISSSPLIFKFLPSSLKSKLRSLFFSRLSSAPALGGSTVLDLPLFYSLLLFFIVLLQPLLCLLIFIYIYIHVHLQYIFCLPSSIYILFITCLQPIKLKILSLLCIYIYLCDFAKRCPLSQCSRNKTRGLAVLLGVN